MPIIKPVSELRNYPDVLKEVREGAPVYLTKNGTGRYVLLDIADYANMEAAERLLILRDGKAEADGAPQTLLQSPGSDWLRAFVAGWRI